jgi:hypothetical protein
MRSRDWSIDVCILSTILDDKPLKQLAYNLTEGLPQSHETVLTIQSFSEEDSDLLSEVVLGFYYLNNPLLGTRIFENEYIAIYERSNIKKPVRMPQGLDLRGDGIIYIGFQARGSFYLPLVICNHQFQTKSRDRFEIYSGTILDMLIDTVDYIDTKTSCYLLERLEKYWYEYPDSKRDVDSWYSLIRKLIRKIAYWDLCASTNFVKCYPNLVVCEQPINQRMRNEKTQALVWKKNYFPNARLVQDSFSLFGYESIVNLCEKAGGFNILRKPNIHEQNLLKIIEDAAKNIFADFFSYYPDCMIIENDSSVYNGTATLSINKKYTYNSYGYLIKYTLVNIAIKKSSLVKEGFQKAFSTYCHELSHCFGGDASVVFSRALTVVIELIAQKIESLEHFNRLWVEYFDNCKAEILST